MGLLLFFCVTGGIGTFIAIQKNRHPAEGFVLGFLLSLVGIFIELFLPSKV